MLFTRLVTIIGTYFMLQKIVLPVILIVLTYGFWVSPDFKEISAGVAIFLFGMLSLEDGFRTFTGGILEKLLHKTTNKLWKSVMFGIVSTTLMQSSSLVSVITISFLSAGLISLAAGIGIIFGANLGTTTGAWLIAGFGLKVKISAYAMPMLVFGIILTFQSSKNLKGIGYILAGLGFLFLGIHYMKEGFESFKTTIDLAEFAVSGYLGLFLFCGIGVFATVVMQSSHATLVLIITALAANQITYENALALAIGANIGTTITAILGSVSANIQGKRLAGAHLIFNMVTAIVAILFIYQIQALVDYLSDNLGIATDDYALRLAVFHTIFNLLGIILMLPWVNRLVTFLNHILSDPEVKVIAPRYLNDASLEFPDTAIKTLHKEVLHLYDNAFEVLAHGLNLHRHEINSDVDLKTLCHPSEKIIELNIDSVYNTKVKVLYSAIIEFVSKAQGKMSPKNATRLFALRDATRAIVDAVKNVKHMRKNLLQYTQSDNQAIRNEYNKLRIQIAELLRTLNALRTGQDVDILELDHSRLQIEENDVTSNGTLDKLIRNQQITSYMATSLMNDSGYAYDASMNLIQAATHLFGTQNEIEQEMESALFLDELEIENIAEKTQ